MGAKILFVTGVAASGKTTVGQLIGQKLDWLFADGDGFHPPENIGKMRSGQPLTDSDRAGWLAAINLFSKKTLENGQSLVVACSALKEAYREKLAEGLPVERVFWAHLHGSFDLISARIAGRKGHFMPPELLFSQFNIWERPTVGQLFDVAENPETLAFKITNWMTEKTGLGLVGLGVMGRNLARNFARNGEKLSLFNRFVAGKEERVAARAVAEFAELSAAQPFESLPDFVASLARPRRIFLMVEAGAAVDLVVEQILPMLDAGDIIMDGGNSHFSDTERRVGFCQKSGVYFLGTGVSGGEEGALRGPAIMVGGERAAFEMVEPFLSKIAAKDVHGRPCLGYFGTGGAGHFVKMAHNGIEYAEMQLLAEAYAALRWDGQRSPEEVAEIFENWGKTRSKSYLLGISAQVLRKREGENWLIDFVSDRASHKGTGAWAAIAACELGAPMNLMTAALFARFIASKKEGRERLFEEYRPVQSAVFFETEDLRRALEAARIVNHHEGFELIKLAAAKHGWPVDLGELARVWSNGCIIRSELLSTAASGPKNAESLLFNPEMVAFLQKNRPSLERTVAAMAGSSRAFPCFSAALAALKSAATAVSAGHLIQAQRDFFGAHLFERTDDPSGKKYHADWHSNPEN